MKKKYLILVFLIGMLVLSGFTTTASFKNIVGIKNILLEETTDTNTATTETTEVTETTEAPTSTPTPVPTATAKPAYSRPLLNLTSYDYDYYDVYAGNTFNLDCVFENLGQQRAYNIVVTYSANSLTANDNGGVDVISSLGANESVTSSQDFYVSTSISSSPATVNVNVEYKDEDGKSYTQTFAVSVTVYGYGNYYTSTPEGRPQIVVANYETDVDTLEPGTIFVLTMNLQNRGYLTAQNLSMVFGGSTSNTSSSSNSSTTTTSSSSNDNFLPLGSSNIQVVGDVSVQQYVQMQQSLVVNSELSPGVYPLSINFSYTDEDGNEYADSQIITLLVYLVPSIEVSFYETPDAFYIGEDGTLPIQVVNIGSDSVLLGDIYINVENATLSNNLTFVGTLESGGSFTIDTDITPQQSGTIPVDITINYQDNFKKAQTITKTLSITVEGTQMSATIDPALVETEMAKMPSTGSETQSNFNIGNILLRFFRGMLGFDSSASSSRSNSGFMNFNTTGE